MSSSLLAKVYGISQEVWNKIPQEERQKLLEAFAEGKYDQVIKMLAKYVGNPEIAPELKIPLELIGASQWSNLFSSGFSPETFVQKAELRGLVGPDCWTPDMLRLVLTRYRRHCIAEGIPETKADLPIQNMATKLGLDLNLLRRLFYGIKLEEKPSLKAKPEPNLKKLAEEAESEVAGEEGKSESESEGKEEEIE